MIDIQKLCYDVIGAAMRVHRFFGDGFLEEVYKNAMLVELQELGLQARTEVAIPVVYHGVRVGDYRTDIIVESQLILELKAVVSLNIRHEAQLVNYLAATGIDDGILFNFGATSLQYKHKYRTYHHGVEKSYESNPVNPVNPVKEGVLECQRKN